MRKDLLTKKNTKKSYGGSLGKAAETLQRGYLETGISAYLIDEDVGREDISELHIFGFVRSE